MGIVISEKAEDLVTDHSTHILWPLGQEAARPLLHLAGLEPAISAQP